MRRVLFVVVLFLYACPEAYEPGATPQDVGVNAGTDAAQDLPTDPTSPENEPDQGLPRPEGSTCALTEWEQMMLDRHNAWRAEVEPPARGMHKLHWNREIAANAAAWIESCGPEWPHSPDSEREGVAGFENLGENLSYCAGTGCSELPEVTDGSGKGDAQGWWEERLDYIWENDASSGVTSHYTQMTSANIYALGCATKLCPAPGPFGWDGMWWWTACQYGPRGQAYWVGNKPYERGDGRLMTPPEEVWQRHEGLCR